jgi:Gpi18-like mannosyltransferase
MFLIVYQIIAGIYVISTSDYQPSGILFVISTIVSLVAFVMIVRLLLYISKLKEIKCDCGMTTQENIIYYFYIVVYSIMLAVILLALLGALGTLFLHK